MANVNRIIDPKNDSDYFEEVRGIFDATEDELPDSFLKLDIILGAAERIICSSYVDNWVSILNGDDRIKYEALRSSAILMVCKIILDSITGQALIISDFKITSEIVVKNKTQSIDDIKKSINDMLERQLAIVGIVHTGGYPERTVVGKSDTYNPYDYYVDTEGAIQEY